MVSKIPTYNSGLPIFYYTIDSYLKGKNLSHYTNITVYAKGYESNENEHKSVKTVKNKQLLNIIETQIVKQFMKHNYKIRVIKLIITNMYEDLCLSSKVAVFDLSVLS